MIRRVGSVMQRPAAILAVRCSVKAVTSHHIILLELQRDRIGVGSRRQGLVERGIEHRNMRQRGQQSPSSLQYTNQVGRVMQRPAPTKARTFLITSSVDPVLDLLESLPP